MMGALYRAATTLAAPALALLLRRRLARGKEDAARLPERRGIAGLPRPAGRLLWVHGASVGEGLSVLPLLARLLDDRPDWHAVITTGTVTSARLLGARLPQRASHQFVPVDVPGWVDRFLDHWRPDAALWLESELWPNLLLGARRRAIPMALVNGRLSEGSYAGWRRWAPGLAADMLGGFAVVLGQTPEDARRFRDLGAAGAECVGNLKLAAPPLPAEQGTLDDLLEEFGTRPRWLAASTHAGEETMAVRVHEALASRHAGLLTVVAPRHPDRAEAIAADLVHAGATVARRSLGQPVTTETDVYLADTMGELGLLFRACPVVFMGKSLIGRGGQNPLEPARLGCAVVFGPHMDNFPEIAPRLVASGAAWQVADEAALIDAVGHLLDHEAERGQLGDAGRRFASAEAQVLDRVAARVLPLLTGGEAA